MRRLVTALLIAVALSGSAEAQVQDSIKGAVREPLRDARIEEEKIAPILAAAESAPYSLVGLSSCSALAGEIGRLTSALGPDVDQPGKTKGEGAAIASAAAGEVVKSFIPGLGVVRVVTGADKQQRRAQAAVYAGMVRRGFLKGVGLSKRCSAAAAPTKDATLAIPDAAVDIPDEGSQK